MPYSGADAFVPTAVAVVRDGLENDERTLVLAAAAKLSDLQDALGADADDVTFVSSEQHARNPAKVAMIFEHFQGLTAGVDDRRARGINDSAPGASRAAVLESRFADCLLNVVALRSWALSLSCLFDVSTLDDEARHAIRQGHGVVHGTDDNADFDPDLAQQLYAEPLDPAPDSAARIVIVADGLPGARAFVRAGVTGLGLPEERVDDLVLAVNEIVTNSLRYGGGAAHVALWSQGDAALCEVRDTGHLADPLVGRFAPPPSSPSGRGLWLAHNLCDLVQVRSSPAGTVVRMQLDA